MASVPSTPIVNWEEKSIGEIALVNYGYTAKASSNPSGPKFLRITDIQDGLVNWDNVPYCPIEENDYAKHKLLEGDIVFARTGATTGKSFLVTDPPESVAASYLIRLRINNEGISPSFLSLFFQTRDYWETISSGTEGAAQGGFNASKLSKLELPFPPLAEQERIVGILDEAFEGIAAATAQAEKNLHNARELFQSVLQDIFSQKGDDWVETTLGELTEKITKGSSPKWQGVDYVEKPGVLFVTSENVGPNRMVFQKTKYVEERFNDKDSKSILQPGDVLTNIVGASIGRTAIYDKDEVANINQAVCLIRCSEGKLVNKYLSYLLNSPYFVSILHDNEINNARANLSLGFFRSLTIPVPKLSEQERLISFFDALSEETKRLEAIYERKKAALAELKQSLLQKAFAGEL